MFVLKNDSGHSESFNNIDRLKDRIEECFFLDGKKAFNSIKVYDQNDNELNLSFETKINIGEWNYLTIKE